MEKSKSYFSGGRKYTNGEITVYWKPSACVHASYCYRELIEVFDPGRRPWVDMQGAPTEEIIRVVNMCPTEALTWKWNDEEKNMNISPDQTNHINFKRPELAGEANAEDDKINVKVKIMPDGPVVVEGNFVFEYNDNKKEFKEGLISLCRCGASHQMPFCDGRHRIAGYQDK